jgi:hypothetical protein
MLTLWHARKCRTKLYLVVYDASHPSTLQTNLGPSFAQWTPFMAIEEGQRHLEPKKKYSKPNVKIIIINEGYFYTMNVLQL